MANQLTSSGIESLESRRVLSVSLLKDIDPGATGSSPGEGIYFSGRYLFAANDGTNGRQLWATDGSSAGTAMLLNISPNVISNLQLTRIGNEGYFTATSSSGKSEIWKTDGTAAGTNLIDTLTVSGSIYSFAAAGSHVLFSVSQSIGVAEYVTDGTAAGTMSLNVPGSQFVTPVPFGSDVLFRSDNASTNGHELWISDGTVAGTKQLASFSNQADLQSITVINGEAYFAGSDTAHGTELWESNGTVAGTALLADIALGTASSNPSFVTSDGSDLYFAAIPLNGIDQLWKSDGTAAGTVQISNISGAAHSGNFLDSITPFGSRVLFENVSDLYVTDGTLAGTVELATNVQANASSDAEINLSTLVVSGTYAYFNQNGADGYELSRTDGSAAGTGEIADINPSPVGAYPAGSSFPAGFIAGPAGVAFFSANDGVHGTEPYIVAPDVSVAAGATVTLNGQAGQALVEGVISIAGSTGAWTGKLDIAFSDVDLLGGSLAIISNQIKQGINTGNWAGLGITSLTAANNTKHLTAVGSLQNNQSGSALYNLTNLFDGIIPGIGDVLIKYTYYGDTNLDGKVDGSDYSRIDNGALNRLTGWFNGDFNYDGVINGSDYSLIDNAYNTQGVSLAAQIAPVAGVARADRAVTRRASVFSQSQVSTQQDNSFNGWISQSSRVADGIFAIDGGELHEASSKNLIV